MTATVVGFVADLSGDEPQIWSANPVIQDGPDLWVIGTPDASSPHHKLHADWDQPNVRRLPDSLSGTPWDEAGESWRVAIVGDAAVRKLQSLARWAPLTIAVQRWSAEVEGYFVSLLTRDEFDELRLSTQRQLVPNFLGIGKDENDSVRNESFDLYRLLAPKQTLEYLATLVAFYVAENRGDRITRVERRAARIGIAREELFRVAAIVRDTHESADRTTRTARTVDLTESIRGLVRKVEVARPDVSPAEAISVLQLSHDDRERLMHPDSNLPLGVLNGYLRAYGFEMHMSARRVTSGIDHSIRRAVVTGVRATRSNGIFRASFEIPLAVSRTIPDAAEADPDPLSHFVPREHVGGPITFERELL